jgi:hypothetical protein
MGPDDPDLAEASVVTCTLGTGCHTPRLTSPNTTMR